MPRSCGECLLDPPPFIRARIPWQYRFPVDGMIGRYKYRGDRKFGRPLIEDFSRFLEQDLREEPSPETLALVPAPMHPGRRRQRGFNHADDIAEGLAKHLTLPIHAGLIRRARRTTPQRALTRAQRLDNLRDVFEVSHEPPSDIAIVDDVVTTGATARVMAANLLEAGARHVEIWALARTPAQGQYDG
ncbi:ComF family protein [Marinobacter koreensis]|uniref:ComF family protein n=1 Tax=Marinobacter koreensis TaxID=335974 RepID=A0ABW0RKC3_9GAMM|nr:ComF family protein [Marinobacter koreensis]MCK7546894.1 ComF family protein [Marinobacter koreensis]